MKKLLFVVIFAIIALGVWGQEEEAHNFTASGFSVTKYEDHYGDDKYIVEVYTVDKNLTLTMNKEDDYYLAETMAGRYVLLISSRTIYSNAGMDGRSPSYFASLMCIKPDVTESIWCGIVYMASDEPGWLEE